MEESSCLLAKHTLKQSSNKVMKVAVGKSGGEVVMIVREARHQRWLIEERRDGSSRFEDQTARQLPDLESMGKKRGERGQDGKRSKKATRGTHSSLSQTGSDREVIVKTNLIIQLKKAVAECVAAE